MIGSFEFVLPTRVVFGRGVCKNLADELTSLGKKHPLVITDKGLIEAGVVEEVVKGLKESGMIFDIFDEIEPNPRDSTVQRGYEVALANGSDSLVAIGGGSSMDTAKAIGVLLTHGGSIRDYEGLGKVEKPICDLVAIPTTVGTGSEVTFWSVITDTERHFKMSIGSPLIAAKVALVDPDLVESLPPSIVASTGMDALTHAVEGYTCTLAEPITDACGIYAIRMIAENIRKAVQENDKEAKANLLLGSLIAGICFGNSDIAGVHCMGEALGGLYDTPHGVAMAILLPYVMEYNYVSDYGKFAEMARALGADTEGLTEESAAYASVLAVRRLSQDLKIPTLVELGVKAEDLPELAKRSAVNVSVDSNPIPVTEKDFLEIFKKAYYN
jgi:alcohol dehydrogenase